MKQKVTTVIAGLGGRGRDIYGRYIIEHPEDIEVTAIADLDPEKRERVGNDFGVPPEKRFESAEEMFAQQKMADCALICTQDKQHVSHAKLAIAKGYHLLLEKPVSDSAQECRELLQMAEEHQRQVVVCHVLRYTPFYNTIKNIIDSKEIGEVVTVQAIENVGYWHQAHSFVRGSWRKKSESSPMILAKCCHDIDILLWLCGKDCKKVSSFGSNYLFKAEKAPEGAALRCTDDCKARANCPYDAVRYYIEDPVTGVKGGKKDWPVNIVAPIPTPESLLEALKTGPYGRCVYHCDNDVVDHQVVNMLCNDDVTIHLTMTAFSDRCYRYLKVMGTLGCIEADMDKNIVSVFPFGKEPRDIAIDNRTSIAGHGGGDEKMMDQFIMMMREADTPHTMQTSLAKSIESHLVALAAEQSRLSGGAALDVQ